MTPSPQLPALDEPPDFVFGAEFDSPLPSDNFRSVWEFGVVWGPEPRRGLLSERAIAEADELEDFDRSER